MNGKGFTTSTDHTAHTTEKPLTKLSEKSYSTKRTCPNGNRTLHFGTSCLSGVINSKADWDGMPSNAKVGYVMAIYDMWFQDNFYDPDYIRNSKIDQETCLWRLGINTNNFIMWIDSGYLNPRNRELAPHNIFFQ